MTFYFYLFYSFEKAYFITKSCFKATLYENYNKYLDHLKNVILFRCPEGLILKSNES